MIPEIGFSLSGQGVQSKLGASMKSHNRRKQQDSAGLRRSRREAGATLALDVIRSIEGALNDRSWTRARLAVESGVPERTIQSWFDQSARERAITDRPLKPRRLRQVLDCLGVPTRSSRQSQFPVSIKPPVDVFLATAMESLASSYSANRIDTLAVISTIRAEHSLSVFYAGESRPSRAFFEDEAWALADNCDVLDRARKLILIYPGAAPEYDRPLASSALIEVGYAIARRLPILIFYSRSLTTLPYLLRKLPLVFSECVLVKYRDLADIAEAITVRHKAFFKAAGAK